MNIGIVGLGKMGSNIARRLAQHGHRIIGYNRRHAITDELAADRFLCWLPCAISSAGTQPNPEFSQA